MYCANTLHSYSYMYTQCVKMQCIVTNCICRAVRSRSQQSGAVYHRPERFRQLSEPLQIGPVPLRRNCFFCHKKGLHSLSPGSSTTSEPRVRPQPRARPSPCPDASGGQPADGIFSAAAAAQPKTKGGPPASPCPGRPTRWRRRGAKTWLLKRILYSGINNSSNQ